MAESSCAPEIRNTSSARSPSVSTLAVCTSSSWLREHARDRIQQAQDGQWRRPIADGAPRSSGCSCTLGETGNWRDWRDCRYFSGGRWRRQLVLFRDPFGELVFDLAQQLAIVACPAMIGDQKSIKRIAMTRRVHARVENAQVAAVEVPANAREQSFLVFDVDQHFGAFTDARQARAHNRLRTLDFAEQRSCMPRDVLRAVPQEVNNVELLPQRIACLIRQTVQPQNAQRFLLAAFEHRGRRDGSAAEQPPRRSKQVLEQLSFPRVPYFRAGAANVGHRQQIQCDQRALVLHARGEALDHGGIGQVLLLRYLRQR